jgi:hypothetical protein
MPQPTKDIKALQISRQQMRVSKLKNPRAKGRTRPKPGAQSNTRQIIAVKYSSGIYWRIGTVTRLVVLDSNIGSSGAI